MAQNQQEKKKKTKPKVFPGHASWPVSPPLPPRGAHLDLREIAEQDGQMGWAHHPLTMNYSEITTLSRTSDNPQPQSNDPIVKDRNKMQ